MGRAPKKIHLERKAKIKKTNFGNYKKQHLTLKFLKMAGYNITGTVFKANDKEVVGKNNFEKRVLWIRTEEQYPQTIAIEFSGTNIDLMDDLKPFDRVDVKFGINGNYIESDKNGNEAVFNTLKGFGLKKLA